MRAHGFRLPFALAAAAIAAAGATVLLRPRSGVLEPAAASATDYFTPAQLRKAHAFRTSQRLIALAGMALEGTLLVLIVARPPRALRRALERAGARPLVGAAAAGAAGTASFTVIALPLSA